MNRRLRVAIAALLVWSSGCGTSDEQGRPATDSTEASVTSAVASVTTTPVASAATTAPASTASSEPTAPAPTTAIPSTTAVDLEAARPYAVTTNRFTLVDASRSTPATDTSEELAGRTINVVLRVPDGDGPVPLVVFSHGLSGHPDAFDDLLGSWAGSGYAVAAPVFPLTNGYGSDFSIADGVSQPGDVSFVLDQMFDESTEIGERVAGRLDQQRVGAAGLSFGGATTYEVALNERVRDHRIRAAVIMAGARFTNPDDGSFIAADVPVYLLHGDADPVVPIDVSQDAYRSFADKAYFATLLGGVHADPFQDETAGRAKVSGMDDVIAESTTAFWDHVLLDDPGAAARLVAAAEVEGLSVIAQNDLCARGLVGDGGYADETIGDYLAAFC